MYGPFVYPEDYNDDNNYAAVKKEISTAVDSWTSK